MNAGEAIKAVNFNLQKKNMIALFLIEIKLPQCHYVYVKIIYLFIY